MNSQMVGVKFLVDEMVAVLASDTASFGYTAKLAVGLVKAPFTPSRNLVFADLVEADFSGYARCVSNVNNGLPGVDPRDGLWRLEPKRTVSSLGGYRFMANALIAGPQPIYGWALFLATVTFELLATAAFPQPIPIANENDAVWIPELRVIFPNYSVL